MELSRAMVGFGNYDSTAHSAPVISTHRRPFRIAALFWLALLASFARGDSQSVSVEPGMIELRVPKVPATALLDWDPKQPVDLPYRTYILADGDGVLITSAPAGTKFVVESNLVDWNGTRITQVKTRWIVTVVGEPGPLPPAPVPFPPTPVPPAPTPTPTPTDVSNVLGIGRIAYTEAVKVNDPLEAALLSEAFRAQAYKMHQGGLPKLAADEINLMVVSLGPEWQPWTAAVATAMVEARKRHGSGIAAQRDQYWEVHLALKQVPK